MLIRLTNQFINILIFLSFLASCSILNQNFQLNFDNFESSEIELDDDFEDLNFLLVKTIFHKYTLQIENHIHFILSHDLVIISSKFLVLQNFNIPPPIYFFC